MNPEAIWDFSPIYSAWFDKPVVLLVKIRQFFVPMPCNIIGETNAAVRIRLQPGWEIDVRKELIVAVEEATASRETWMN
jgi:hypothetical protein